MPFARRLASLAALLLLLLLPATRLAAQGVTTGSIGGIVADKQGNGIADAIITAIHQPSGTQYRGVSRAGGAYQIPAVRVGGPYRVSVTVIGYRPAAESSLTVALGAELPVNFSLEPATVQVAELTVNGVVDPVMNADRTGAATFVNSTEIAELPSVKRSIRDVTRLDPRSDGNYAFGGRNWLYNNISVDGSYFGNAFGLDDPAPGGQSNAEPIPYDAVDQVQVSIAPFDVRQGGFTGASINTVTKSGTNTLRGSLYGFGRNQSLAGNTENGNPVIASPSLKYYQTGFSLGGPIKRDKLFFFVSAEVQRNQDPGTDFVASANGVSSFGVSRVRTDTMNIIRQRMISAYNYDPGAFQDYTFHTDNDKLLARIDWNLSANSNLTFRYDYLNAHRDQGPHPFVLSFNNTGRGPNDFSLPFYSSGYAIHNKINSYSAEWNVRHTRMANRLFASYNRFRDFRAPFSKPFPTVEIGNNGITYTTLGEEPFSAHNILNSDIFQVTDNVTFFRGKHAITVGSTFESFNFFNSFNIFRNGLFFLPAGLFPGCGCSTFSSVAQFLNETDPANPNQVDFNSMVGTGLYKGEKIHVGQLAFYIGDEHTVSSRLNLSYGLRADIPMYFTKPVANPYSTGLAALDQNGQPEVVDQARMPSQAPLLSPRFGFNYDVTGDRRTQLRGGSGFFTGRVPFVWIGNVISNPGANPNLYPAGPVRPTGDSSTLAQSFDLNAVSKNFKFPQIWTTDIAIDHRLPWQLLGTFEATYSKDLHAVVVRNADLVAPRGTVGVDARPFYGNCGFGAANCPAFSGSPSLNSAAAGGPGIYVLDNINKGHSTTLTAQLRRQFAWGANVGASYTWLDARNALKSTEIASVLWQNQPVTGDPNNPGVSYSEFGQRNRVVAYGTYQHTWTPRFKTQVGLYWEAGEGNRFSGAGGNRYSYIYAGDVNGDGQSGNDLIYIPRTQADILLDPCPSTCGTNTTAAQQWAALDAFINQDPYLSKHRGQTAQRFGALNPWYTNLDLRVLQDIGLASSNTNSHRLQVSLDILNFGNLINSHWGVRKVASAAATSPLTLVRFQGSTPVFNFTGPSSTFIDDPNPLSRWQMQLGLRYNFNQ